ncbi:DUF255 domain-containing protein [Bacillus atrophaeus]|nr:DUF255 domain-containing protein [Bacillus atrophaeus]MCY9111163.1 DUF255 domain-containing protein [Bacillus atrophaeus]
MPNNSKPNRLIAVKSAYSLQYAHPLVDWHPWREEAFEKAKRENNSVHRLLDLSLVAG